MKNLLMKIFFVCLFLTLTNNIYSQAYSSVWKPFSQKGDELRGTSSSSGYSYITNNYLIKIRNTETDSGIEIYLNDGIIDFEYLSTTYTISTTKVVCVKIGLYSADGKLIKTFGFPKNVFIVDKTLQCAYSYRDSLFKIIIKHLKNKGNYIRIIIPMHLSESKEIFIPSLY